MSLVDWILGLERVQFADTRVEREAVWRFRYDVYVRELGKTVPSADPVNGWVRDPDEDNPEVSLVYTGSVSEVTGTMRGDHWLPGRVPAATLKKYGLLGAPGLLAQPLAEASRLMVRRQLRGKLIMPALARAGYTWAVEKGVRASFAYCAPGLVSGYRRLGYRPYGADMIDTTDGLRVPLVMALDDVGHYRAVGSPLHSLAKERFGQGSEATTDLINRELGLPSAIEVDEGEVWNDVQTALLVRPQRPHLFDGLNDAQIRLITGAGFVIEVGAKGTVTREDLSERELFVILEGEFAVTREARVVATLKPGDVIGEIGFFLESGRRSATITAQTAGKLLVLRRRMLEELQTRDAAVEHQLLMNLARITAARLAAMVSNAR